jgi:eukaryotic-like serine/threonine-protein kinase
MTAGEGDDTVADTGHDTLADTGDMASARTEVSDFWQERGIDPGPLFVRRGTIVRAEAAAAERAALMTLPPLLAHGETGAPPQFVLGELLGEGGMGVVTEAEQTALGRVVAVKRPRAGADTLGQTPQLLREARVTGVLEHPNVVPVYALGRDADDRPLIVMKRIEGRAWGDLLEEECDRADDGYLHRHLGILKQAASAVHFAHSKGVIHRDLKPANVMIGSFGEVYVLDWGIAVSVREDGVRDVPLARTLCAVEGTPAYMAPEMALGDGSSIDERTDIYLLGSILYQVLSGKAPYDAPKLRDSLEKAFDAKPNALDDTVPAGLREICERAMARKNRDRFPTAAAFADAVDAFEVRRGSTRLSDEARRRLDAMKAILDAPPSSRAAEESAERRHEETYRVFNECRFGFIQALRAWEENEDARSGLQEGLERMIEYELERDAAPAAAALVRELPEPRPELAARVEAAVRRQRAAGERLRKLERDVDLRIGERLRTAIVIAVAGSWGLVSVAAGIATRSGIHEVSHAEYAAVQATFAVGIGATGFLRRATLLGTAANRRLTLTAVLAFGAYALLWALAGHVAMPMAQTGLVQAMLGLCMWLTMSFVDRRFLGVAASGAITLVAIVLSPRYFFEWHGLFGGGLSAVASALWRPPPESE